MKNRSQPFLCRLQFVRLLAIFCMLYILIGISLKNLNPIVIVPDNRLLHQHVIKYDKIFHKQSKSIKILLWTRFFDSMHWEAGVRDQISNCNCSVTSNRSEIEAADVIVFHLLDIWIYDSLPKYRADHQIWILYVAEPPPHIFSIGLRVPNMKFNWTMSYRRDSTIKVPYGEYTRLTHNERSHLNLTPSVYKTKSKFMASVISNCFDGANRYREMRELKKYVSVDEFGRCGDLICPRTGSECPDLLKKYMFKIAFENSHCRDYVTEKFWSAYDYFNIPIVNWKRNQGADAPPNSYINIYDFKNMRDVAKYLIKVSKNETLYNSYFKWRNDFKASGIALLKSFRSVCEKVHSSLGYQAQVLVNPWDWIQDDSCKMWTITNMIKRRWNRFKFDMKIL